MKRRTFLKNSVLAAAGATLSTRTSPAAEISYPPLKFGICADLHQDVMHDGPERLKKFIDAMNAAQVDFIIQLGDFCRPYDHNRIIVDIWNEFKGPRYHVLGNHDTDGGFTREQVVEFWGAPGKYYSFDIKGYHCVVLDGNEGEKRPEKKYPSVFSKEQLSWLERDLSQTDLPTLVFLHQGLESDTGVENAMKVRCILEAANREKPKVRLVFSGHHHLDYHNVINDIHYLQINSMSYHFIGKKYRHASYGPEILEKHPKIWETTPYRDPLWALVEIRPDGTFILQGQKSVYVGPSPRERGEPRFEDLPESVPYISDRQFSLLI